LKFLCTVVLFSFFISGTSLAGNGRLAIIGDSIFAYKYSKFRVGQYLGILQSDRVLDHSVGGAVLLLEFVGSWPNKHSLIPRQYRDYIKKEANNIQTVIFDGGANDALLNIINCGGDLCPKILEKLINQIQSLLDEMYADGIKNAIYLAYYDFKGIWKQLNPFFETLSNGVKIICQKSDINCIFVDPGPVFLEKEKEFRTIVWDGLHPTSRGTLILATLLVDALKALKEP
jgi:hypothetical protein